MLKEVRTFDDLEVMMNHYMAEANKDGSDYELDMSHPSYKKAREILSDYTKEQWPLLYEAMFDEKGLEDLFFRDTSISKYAMYYYNPDSVAGGQIVRCSMDEEQALRIYNGEEETDVLAESLQYLSDINTSSFFETILHLLYLKDMGRYLGNEQKKVCKDICLKEKLMEPNIIHSSGYPTELEGMSGKTKLLEKMIQKAAKALAEHYRSDVIIRINKDQESGSAWLMDEEEDIFDANQTIGILVQCVDKDIVKLQTRISLKDANHCVPQNSPGIKGEYDRRTFTSLDAAMNYLKIYAL